MAYFTPDFDIYGICDGCNIIFPSVDDENSVLFDCMSHSFPEQYWNPILNEFNFDVINKDIEELSIPKNNYVNSKNVELNKVDLKKKSTFFLKKKQNQKRRINFWRTVNSKKNEQLRAAIYLYRFTPHKLGFLKKQFKIPSKTLMRYIRDSASEEFKIFNLFFGRVGIINNDKLLEKKLRKTTKALPDIEIPELAKKYI